MFKQKVIVLRTEQQKTSYLAVVADSVNPILITRNEWIRVANTANSDFINIEIVCSDGREHQNRVESRKAEVKNLKLPTWSQVNLHHYEPWVGMSRIQIDTAGKSVDESFKELVAALPSPSETR